MDDYHYGKFIASLHAALARRPRSEYLRRVLAHAQARVREMLA